MIELSKKSNKVAKAKWPKLQEILVEIQAKGDDLDGILSVINAKKDQLEITTHQNPRLDRFLRKATTKSFDLLTDLGKALDLEVQKHQPNNSPP